MPSPIWRLKLTQACTYSGTARPARPARLARGKGKCRTTRALRSTWPTWTGWGERRSGQPWTSGLRQTWRTWWQGWSRTTGYFFLFGVPIQGPNFQPWRRLLICLTVCLVWNLKMLSKDYPLDSFILQLFTEKHKIGKNRALSITRWHYHSQL